MSAPRHDRRVTGFYHDASRRPQATADSQGRPDCSYKGGDPGFVRVLDPTTVAFPSYDGNGMYRSMGSALVNPRGRPGQGRPLGGIGETRNASNRGAKS